jgi:hypothetical protein
MCSIIGSFKKSKIVELCELNKYRGTYSHSISYFDPEVNDLFYISKSFGEIDYDRIDIPDGMYCIVHMQAPTTENKSQDFIHPAIRGFHYLYHNGILKDPTIRKLQTEFFSKSTWDSALLLDKMIGDKVPDDIDGSFSCLYINSGIKSGMYLFRNALAPMFIDNDFNISSTKFEGAKKTQDGVIYIFDPFNRVLSSTAHFETVNNPYRMKNDKQAI